MYSKHCWSKQTKHLFSVLIWNKSRMKNSEIKYEVVVSILAFFLVSLSSSRFILSIVKTKEKRTLCYSKRDMLSYIMILSLIMNETVFFRCEEGSNEREGTLFCLKMFYLLNETFWNVFFNLVPAFFRNSNTNWSTFVLSFHFIDWLKTQGYIHWDNAFIMAPMK